MNQLFDRRHFLRSASLGVGAVAALPLVLSPWVRAQTPQALLRTPAADPDKLAAVARQALDAARQAGAQYADVRIQTGVRLIWVPTPNGISSVNEPDRRHSVGRPQLENAARIGVRVWLDGHLGFAGNLLSYDADQTAALARLAVSRAKVWQAAGPGTVELAPAPVVENGQYQTPIRIDPFNVSIGEQEALLLEAVQAVRNTTTTGWLSMNLEVEWRRLDELFASTEGSLIRQRIYASGNGGGFWTRPKVDDFAIVTSTLGNLAGARGYEAFDGLKERMAEAARRAEELRQQPVRPAEPGSYEVVLGPRAVGQLLAQTVGRPLELDRALLRAAASKDYATSYAIPPAEVLGQFEVGNELLNVRADRTRAGLCATVGWDSEGTPASQFDLIRGGVLTSYLSDRSTASALKDAYAKQGLPVQSNGCANDSGGLLPKIKLPNLALLPGQENLSEDDLVKDVKRGYYINDLYTNADHSGLNVQARGMHVRQIVDGKKADIVQNASLQFNTTRFWQELVALGGADSVGIYNAEIDEPDIEKNRLASMTVPPIRVRRVNVVNTGRRGSRSA